MRALPERVDFAVVGGGPAGLAAASLAMELGLSTLLLDQHPAPSGLGPPDPADIPRQHLMALRAAFAESDARYAPSSIVWQAAPDGRIGVLRAGEARLIRAERILLATGAYDRPVPIPGWTLPGVMSAGAALSQLESGQVPDGPVVVAGSTPVAYRAAVRLARAGAPPRVVLTTAPCSPTQEAQAEAEIAPELRRVVALAELVVSMGIRLITGATDIAVEGHGRAEAVAFTHDGRRQRIPARLVLLHEGRVPHIQLSLAARCRHVWSPAQLSWRPETDAWCATNVDRIAVAGDAAGINSTESDAGERDRRAQLELDVVRAHRAARTRIDSIFRLSPAILAPEQGDIVLCRCEEVTVRELRGAVALGGTDPNRAKLFARCGMGACQGRLCLLPVAGVIARERGVPIDTLEPFHIRIPVSPVPLAVLAALPDAEEVGALHTEGVAV
jgi:NADPH-dependent 2,4-dienoyl-CoA reductase/sulfur reductase-like enzyme